MLNEEIVYRDSKNQIEGLMPPQAEVLGSGLLSSGFSCVLQMPTGSGKTWLAEQAIRRTIESGGRAIYLTPLRAQASELIKKWREQFGETKAGVFTGDYGKPGNPYPVSFNNAQVLIMTPEKLDACTRAWRAHWNWIPLIDLVVVDELHLLGEDLRGGRLEGTLSRFRRLNPFARLIGLSATLGNRTKLADWLEGIEYASNWRPVPLTWRIARYRRPEEKPELLAQEVTKNITKGGKSLVFVQSRHRAEQLSSYLQKQGFRTAHHHAGLNYKERKDVETGYRDEQYELLVATATLEMGLNLPARQVVLYDMQKFDGLEFRGLSTNSVWQRAGRAGRPGLDEEGEVVLIAPQWDQGVEDYFNGNFEPILSQLSKPQVVAEQIVAEVASGLGRTTQQLKNIFGLSLAAQQKTLPKIETLVNEMLAAGMIQEKVGGDYLDSGLLQPTRLGRIAVRHMLAPATLIMFKRVLESNNELDFLDILITAASSPDCEPVLPVDFEELEQIAAVLEREPTRLLQQGKKVLTEQLGITGKRLLAALKMAVVIRSYTRKGDGEQVGQEFGCYPFEIEQLVEGMQRLLLAMRSMLDVSEERKGILSLALDMKGKIQALQHMCSSGLNEDVSSLTLIKGIGPAQARKLYQAGITNISELGQASITILAGMKGLSSERAKQWIEEARQLTTAHKSDWYKETGSGLELAPAGWPIGVDPYRLRRALELKVRGPDGGLYLVSGGLEPHLVKKTKGELECDCADSNKGFHCKHALAVRLALGDLELRHYCKQMDQSGIETKINLFELWFEGGSKRR